MLINYFSLGFRAPIVSHPGIGFQLMTILTLTVGALLVLWLAESITKRGIGYGVSLIICADIAYGIPKGISSIFGALFYEGTLDIGELIIFLSLIAGSILATRYMLLAEKKLPVRYNGEQTIDIPLRICPAAGIIAIFFAIYALSLPQTFATFVPGEFIKSIVLRIINPLIYWPLYAVLIIVFTYLYVALITDAQRLADNLHRYGGFISDISPGGETAKYADKTFALITLQGALFFVGIVVLPALLQKKLGIQAGFAGASVLIIVGVILDIIKQHQLELLFESRRNEGWHDVYNTSDLIEAGAIKSRFSESGIDSVVLTTSGTLDPIKGIIHFIFHKWDADEIGIGNVGAIIMVKSDKVEDAETIVDEDFSF